MKMKTIILVATCIVAFTACTVKPPAPKQPSKLNRVPVNKSLPIELEI